MYIPENAPRQLEQLQGSQFQELQLQLEQDFFNDDELRKVLLKLESSIPKTVVSYERLLFQLCQLAQEKNNRPNDGSLQKRIVIHGAFEILSEDEERRIQERLQVVVRLLFINLNRVINSRLNGLWHLGSLQFELICEHEEKEQDMFSRFFLALLYEKEFSPLRSSQLSVKQFKDESDTLWYQIVIVDSSVSRSKWAVSFTEDGRVRFIPMSKHVVNNSHDAGEYPDYYHSFMHVGEPYDIANLLLFLAILRNTNGTDTNSIVKTFESANTTEFDDLIQVVATIYQEKIDACQLDFPVREILTPLSNTDLGYFIQYVAYLIAQMKSIGQAVFDTQLNLPQLRSVIQSSPDSYGLDVPDLESGDANAAPFTLLFPEFENIKWLLLSSELEVHLPQLIHELSKGYQRLARMILTLQKIPELFDPINRQEFISTIVFREPLLKTEIEDMLFLVDPLISRLWNLLNSSSKTDFHETITIIGPEAPPHIHSWLQRYFHSSKYFQSEHKPELHCFVADNVIDFVITHWGSKIWRMKIDYGAIYLLDSGYLYQYGDRRFKHQPSIQQLTLSDELDYRLEDICVMYDFFKTFSVHFPQDISTILAELSQKISTLFKERSRIITADVEVIIQAYAKYSPNRRDAVLANLDQLSRYLIRISDFLLENPGDFEYIKKILQNDPYQFGIFPNIDKRYDIEIDETDAGLETDLNDPYAIELGDDENPIPS